MKVVTISEHTKFPLSFLIMLAPIIGGAIMWLTSMYLDVAMAKSAIVRVENQVNVLQNIDTRLSRIEGRLGIERREPEAK